MEKKINISELLKDCPKGIELYSPLFGELKFDSISRTLIWCRDVYREMVSFESDGKYNSKYHKAECVLFPSKDVRTWKGFQRPFKNGDIISNDYYIAIFYKLGTPCHCTSTNVVYYHCYYSPKFGNFKEELDFGIGTSTEFRYATEEEKQKLFDAIKDNGYKWNPETKTLEKLIEPKFKVGQKIHSIAIPTSKNIYIIKDICSDKYIVNKVDDSKEFSINISIQGNWELVPNKFDIGTLKPFDKVLVRFDKDDQWQVNIFSHIDEDLNNFCHKYVTINYSYPCMIPYEGNEHLLGTTDDCDEFYKTWK